MYFHGVDNVEAILIFYLTLFTSFFKMLDMCSSDVGIFYVLICQ